jgi:hypothetical protein
MPEVKPPIAPDRALNCESEAFTAHRSTLESGWSGFGISGRAAAEGAAGAVPALMGNSPPVGYE